MTITIDRNGLLTEPNLHDGFVDGVQLTDEKSAAISLRAMRGQTFVMKLLGLEAFFCNDFRQGNIIHDVEITCGKSPEMRALSFLFIAPHPSAVAQYHEKHKAFLERQVERITSGELTLVSIAPSYGCELVGLCHELLITPSQ